MSLRSSPTTSAVDYDEESLKAKIKQLKCQRSYRRGQITKLSKRLDLLLKRPPGTVSPSVVSSLGNEIRVDIQKHDHLQEELEMLTSAPTSATEDADKEKHDDLHLKLISDLEALTLTCGVHQTAKLLCTEIRGLLALGSSVSSSKEEFKQVASAKAELHAKVLSLPEDSDAQHLFESVNNLFEELRLLMATSTPPTISTTPATTTTSSEPKARMAPLNLEVPKFNGDPLQWEAFELSLKSLLKHRAEGFSDTDKYAIVRQAISPPQGKQLVADKLKSGASVDQLLDELRRTYGRPQLVIPVLVQKVMEPPRTDQSVSALRRFKESVLVPYRSLEALIKGDLGLFLPHFLRPFMEGKLREDWERLLFEKLSTPSMKDLENFIEQRLLWADMQSRSGSSNLNPNTNAFSTSSYDSSSTSSTTSSRPPSSPKRRSAMPAKCASCGEAHWLGTEDGIGWSGRRGSASTVSLRLMLDQQPATGTLPAPPTAPPTVAVVDAPASAEPAPVGHETGNFICTVVARIQHKGSFIKARVLLDHGSGGSFMAEELATQLALPRHPQDRLFEGFGQGTIRSKFKVYASLMSTTSTFTTSPIEFSIIPHAFTTSPPADRDAVLGLASQQGLALSDPLMGGRVDIILGEEHPWDVCGQVTRINRHRFIATEFGYGVVGPLASHAQVLTIVPQETTIQDDLAKLWSLDKVPEASTLTADEQRAIDIFNSTTTFKDGRVTVTLPVKQDPPPLGESRRHALSRFFQNERSLKAKGKLGAFSQALGEYLTMGHAHIIPSHQLHIDLDTYYMPVHGVFKDASSTTKVRPVFDASAKTTSGASLNDRLLIGPNLYPPLQQVLIKMRLHAIAMSADIAKMFREICLSPHQQDLHRFLLRIDERIVDCRMSRVTFGVASSPFLATQTLRFLAQHFEASHPQAAAALRSVFYVDDFVSGADTLQHASELRVELCDLLAKAGMVLRKWRSNSKDFLEHVPPDLRENDSTAPLLADSPKALGIHWDTVNDHLHVSVPEPTSPTTVTKRHVASVSAGVFDILGLYSPVTITARIILQETWRRQLKWDKELPQDLQTTWKVWTQQLTQLKEHPIPRQYFQGSAVFLSLHGFSDASTLAYGAVVYLRAVQIDGSTHTALVTSKARVLPVRHITVPKAELLGAHLLSKLLSSTAETLNIDLNHLFAWTDSTIVLHWLTKTPSQLKERFVANRVQSIADHLPSTNWHHVPTDQNPADLASRGMPAPDLITSQLWWSGPRWLSESPDTWPVSKITRPPEAINVLAITTSHSMELSQDRFLNSLWDRYSSFSTLTRILAWIYRFYNKLKNKMSPDSVPLTSKEINQARHKIFSLSHRQDFSDVYSAVQADRTLPNSHPLHKLLPVIQDDMIYLKSRVRNKNSPRSPRLLIPLHSKSRLTRLWVKTVHISNLHPGVTALHSIVADSFFIPGLRNLLKNISRACRQCQLAYARPLSHQLGLLPSVRTTPSPPFQKTGLDFAGPFIIKRGYTRKPTYDKCYAAVFICMATKAVHLDLCASLSTVDFRATLSRFVARRGCPTDFYSDNGSNFQGAREEIRELEALLGSQEGKQMTSKFAEEKGITWHNIPPRAPHFGGLWEAAVRTMKVLLRKNLKPHPLRYDELYSLLVEAEATLNSRPLTPLKDDETTNNDYITSGHFLVGRPLRALPTPTPPKAKVSTLRRWRLVSKLKEDLWNTWITQYLRTLHERDRWIRPQQPLQVGDLVFVKDEVLRQRNWPIARIQEVFPGDDGQVRAVKLLCRGKSYTRATRLLIPFRPESEDTRNNDEQSPTTSD